MSEPVKGVAYDFALGLDAVLTTGFQANPTLAAGDFKISKDYGTFANLATLPIVAPASSTSVKISLSATEMDADKIVVFAQDQAGDEWNERRVFIDNPVANSQSAVDILEGDHIETSTTMLINKKGTATPLVSKSVTGSLLNTQVTIRTNEP